MAAGFDSMGAGGRRAAAMLLSGLLLAAQAAGAQAVTQVPSTVALQITTPLTVFYGEAVDGLAQVTAQDGSAVTGTVTFYDGSTGFCTLTLANGASCPASVAAGFGAGTHVFSAAYSGDATHAAATSNAVTVVVEQDTTATTVASSANSVTAGGNVMYTAAVQGAHGRVAGAVEFFDGTASMGQAALDANGQARLSVLMTAPGAHAITAVYAGTANSAGSTSAVLNLTVNAGGSGAGDGDGFTLGLSQVTVAAGATAEVPVRVVAGSGFARAMSVSCSGLPEEAACSYAGGALSISTMGPRACGTTTPYGTAGVPFAGPMLAGLLVIFVPKRRRAMRGLLAAICAVLAMGSMTGCGLGNCTDLGTRPGTYVVTVMGSSGGAAVSQKVKLVVTP